MHYVQDKYRDILIKIGLFCKETELTSFVDCTNDLDILLNNSNPILNELFDHAFMETTYSKRIETVDWDNSK